MAQDVIAIICDCDGTLCPDTSDKFVRDLGIDSEDFWRRQVDGLVQDGWDPPLAYLSRLLELSRNEGVPSLTREALRGSGEGVEFYQGALDFVPRLRAMLSDDDEYREAGITIEWYIVSSGIEALLRATALQGLATDIFAGEYAFDESGRATAVKRTVTFTEKTKFIYAINKGITGAELRRRPYRVNDAMEPKDRRIPFENMIYVGDGPSDIPCFSMIRYLGGKGIGVMPPEDTELRRPYQLATGQRLTVGPYTADYREGTDLYKMMARMVTSIADSIVFLRNQQLKSAPAH